MKRTICLGLLVMMVFCGTPRVFADTPVDKLGRGITNMITGPGEILHHLSKQQDNHPTVLGLVNGVLYGTFFMIMREIAGVYEIGTFILPIPWRYRPVMDPPTIV